MADKQTIAVYDQKVDSYLEMIKEQANDPHLARFIQELPTAARVLDLGCGPAISSKVLKDEGFDVDPIDASSEMVAAANKRFSVGARVASFDEIDAHEEYDGIWANFSLLHCTRREFSQVLEKLAHALKRGGSLHIGMKLGAGEKRDSIGRFYSYYSEKELHEALSQVGLTIIRTTHGEGPGLAGGVEPWLIILSKK